MPFRATLHPYRLPLRAPLRLASGTLRARDGVLLRLEDPQGRVGWGEAAPLPGFSPDTLAEAEAALRAWMRTGEMDARSPAARAALDGAQMELDAQAAGVSIAQLIDHAPSPTLHLAALLAGDDHLVVARAAEVRAAGYAAAKLKVGAQTVATDAARVRAVAEALGPGEWLRLDANRAWSFDEACQFAEAVAEVRIAFIEEPLQNPDRLADLADAFPDLPLALDESLGEISRADLARHRYASVVILKPTVLGGLRVCAEWARAAMLANMEAVVSGAFESGIGTRQACALAAALGGARPAGLDPYNFLASDVLAPPLKLDVPRVSLADVLAVRAVQVA